MKKGKNMEEALERTTKGAAPRLAGKYLSFTLAEEDYGIGIVKIKEIIGMMTITSVPQTPSYVKGVINLRGKVIPILSMRRRFGMEDNGYTDRTCIIVVETKGEFGHSIVGIVVDTVSEVVNIKEETIEETPNFGAKLNTEYILGMAKAEGKLKILLDIDRVLHQEVTGILQGMPESIPTSVCGE
jgi:purine-binding chemotaxis protein CheW